MLNFLTTVSRGEVPRDEITDEQMCVINVFGANGAAIAMGVPKVETEEEFKQFMSRVRFWERFCPLANRLTDDNEWEPFPIPEDAVKSLMPIYTNVSSVSKTKFVQNIVASYAPYLR